MWLRRLDVSPRLALPSWHGARRVSWLPPLWPVLHRLQSVLGLARGSLLLCALQAGAGSVWSVEAPLPRPSPLPSLFFVSATFRGATRENRWQKDPGTGLGSQRVDSLWRGVLQVPPAREPGTGQSQQEEAGCVGSPRVLGPVLAPPRVPRVRRGASVDARARNGTSSSQCFLPGAPLLKSLARSKPI